MLTDGSGEGSRAAGSLHRGLGRGKFSVPLRFDPPARFSSDRSAEPTVRVYFVPTLATKGEPLGATDHDCTLLFLLVMILPACAPASSRQTFDGTEQSIDVLVPGEIPVIDIHLHVYSDDQLPMPAHPTYPEDIPSARAQGELIAQTIAQMDAYNVVLGLLHDSPENIDRARENAPGRFLAFPRIGGRFSGGTLGDEPTPADFKREIQAGNWAGIGEVATVYNGLDPLDANLWPYYEIAQELHVPIFWHTGTRPRMTLTQEDFRAAVGKPTRWEDILAQYPNMRAVLLHGGHPFRDEIVAVMMTYPWVYMDTGPFGHVRTPEQFYAYFGYLIEMGLGDRIMFGSDQMGWPRGIGTSIEVILQAPWDEQTKRDILYNNAARFLALTEDQIRTHHQKPSSPGQR